MIGVRLLHSATQVLDRPDFPMNGAWPRAVAFLARQALEEALGEYWDRTLLGMRQTTYRTQLTCFRTVGNDRDLGEEVAVAWAFLTRACHHHPYELAPTASELENWLRTVERLVARIQSADSAT